MVTRSSKLDLSRRCFTSLLLADMVNRNQATLDDPAAKYLPESVKMPERGGKSITLLHLSTHSSGLPRLPSNMKWKDPRNPYADYSVDDLLPNSFPATRCCAILVPNSNIQTWAGDYSATSSRTAPERIMRT